MCVKSQMVAYLQPNTDGWQLCQKVLRAGCIKSFCALKHTPVQNLNTVITLLCGGVQTYNLI